MLPASGNRNGSELVCRMPVVGLPEDLSEELNQSESGTINGTDGSGVAVYWASDGSTRADIYVGLELDGFTRYRNISADNPDIDMQFAIRPILYCADGDVSFDPTEDTIISIKVRKSVRRPY